MASKGPVIPGLPAVGPDNMATYDKAHERVGTAPAVPWPGTHSVVDLTQAPQNPGNVPGNPAQVVLPDVPQIAATATSYGTLPEDPHLPPDSHAQIVAALNGIVPVVRAEKSSATAMGDIAGKSMWFRQIASPSHGQRLLISSEVMTGITAKICYAVDPQGHPYALKVMRSELAAPRTPEEIAQRVAQHREEGRVVRSLEEIRKEVALQNRISTLPISQIWNVQGNLYLQMPIMRGELYTLLMTGDWLDGDAIPEPQDRQRILNRIMLDLANFLVRMLDQGYLHRDVKAENILFDADGNLHLLDFGWTTSLHANGMVSGVAGSPMYSAPEIPSHHSSDQYYNETADAWALGWIPLLFYPEVSAEIANLAKETQDEISRHYAEWRASTAAIPAEERAGKTTSTAAPVAAIPWKEDLVASEEGLAHEEGMAAIFKALHAVDPELCDFLTRRVLITDPLHRASLAEVRDFFVRRTFANGDEQERAACENAWQQWQGYIGHMAAAQQDEIIERLRQFAATEPAYTITL